MFQHIKTNITQAFVVLILYRNTFITREIIKLSYWSGLKGIISSKSKNIIMINDKITEITGLLYDEEKSKYYFGIVFHPKNKAGRIIIYRIRHSIYMGVGKARIATSDTLS